MTDDAQAWADRLIALEHDVDTLDAPAALLAVVSKIDALGVELATQLRTNPAPPLQRVLASVPTLQVRAMLRAAEKLDDAGSPRRAAFVLLEALRVVFDPSTLATVTTALAFTLEAHGQAEPATSVRALVSVTGSDRREQRARFLAKLDDLRASIDWSALDDELGLD